MEETRRRGVGEEEKLRVVTTKPCYGLPTSCPNCLPLYFYLKFANTPFSLSYHSTFPDSEQIPYVESDTYVAYNNENGGIIECLRKDGIADLDSDFHNIPEWISMKAMIKTWLEDSLMYELWVDLDKKPTRDIYFSDLPWPIGPILYFKKARSVKQRFGITSENAERIEAEIYKRASLAYEALSTHLGDGSFIFGDRPTSLDALFLGHALITAQALPDTSVLKSKLLNHSNLVKYMKKHSEEYIGDGSLWSTIPFWSSVPSSSSGQSSTSTSNKGGFTNWSSKPKTKPKRERTEEEKKFRRRAKYFLGAQLIAVLVFLSLFGSSDASQAELEDGDDDIDYYD